MSRFGPRALSLVLFLTSRSASGAEDLLSLSIEELSQLKVTSVSKVEESLLAAPSAVYVLTREDIRRSGVVRIVDALRLVPGLQVVQTNAHSWSVGARGFGAQGFSNKMLVLVDGRSVYSPLFSGVFWDHHDYPIHTIDRIEVIRGPGATLYGANAVNGVINIITKDASQTHGQVAEAYGGLRGQGGEFVKGGSLGESTDFRVAGSIQNVPSFSGNIDDENQGGHVTTRIDADLGDGFDLTNHTDFFLQETDETRNQILLTPPFATTEREDLQSIGLSDTLRIAKQFAPDESASVQLYYDFNQFEYGLFSETRNTGDLQTQYNFAFLNDVADRQWYERRHEITLGTDVRISHDNFYADEAPLRGGSMDPSSRTFWEGGGFLQDRVTLVEDLLEITAGIKLGGNEWSGFEVQPSGRFSFTPYERHGFWGAISRAVRTPTRLEHDSDLPIAFLPAGSPALFGAGPLDPAFPAYYVLGGNPDMNSEELLSYELGYRADLRRNLRLDVAGFYNRYDRLLFARVDPITLQSTDGLTYNYVPLVVTNDLKGDTYGFEVVLWYQPLDWWTLQGSYSYLELDLEAKGGTDPFFFPTAENGEKQEPRNAFVLWSHLVSPFDFELWIVRSRDFSLDNVLRYVDDLPLNDVDEYYGFDSRLAWRPMPQLELSVLGQNLITGHREAKSTNATQIPRSVFGMVTVRFGAD